MHIPVQYNTIQCNAISFIADDKNKDREVSADTSATETYYMEGIIKANKGKYKRTLNMLENQAGHNPENHRQ